MTVRIVPLPLSISNAYLLLGDRPVLVDAGSRVKRKSYSTCCANMVLRRLICPWWC